MYGLRLSNAMDAIRGLLLTGRVPPAVVVDQTAPGEQINADTRRASTAVVNSE